MASETYALTIFGNLQGQYRTNVLHFEGTGVDTNDTHAATKDLVNAFDVHLKTYWLAMLPISYCMDLIRARRIHSKPSAQTDLQYQPYSAPGTRGNNATSQQCNPSVFMVPVMNFKVGAKIFLPAIAQADLVNNSVVAAWTTAVQNFMNVATAGFSGALYSWQLGIWSRKYAAFSRCVSYHPSPFIGYIHKRKLQSGRGGRKRRP